MAKPRACVIIPAFNEARTIARVVRKCHRHLRDVLVIDDGSTDRTAERAWTAGATVLRLPANQGKGAALAAGFSWARPFAAVVVMDADGQHDPADLPRFLEALARFDVVVGIRRRRGTMPLLNRASNKLTSAVLSWVAGAALPDSQSGYRAIRRRVLSAITLQSRRFDAESEFLIKAARAGYRIGGIPIATTYTGKKSHISKARDTARFVQLLWRARKWVVEAEAAAARPRKRKADA